MYSNFLIEEGVPKMPLSRFMSYNSKIKSRKVNSNVCNFRNNDWTFGDLNSSLVIF